MAAVRQDVCDRARGALYGLACGDALGAAVETRSHAEVVAAYGSGGPREIVGGGWLRLEAGETTDDTAMALCVAEGVADAGAGAPLAEVVSAVGARFAAWFGGNPPDVGRTTACALRSFLETGSWDAAAARVAATLGERAGGNGSLMRTLPLSLAWPAAPARLVAASRAIARMTHPAADAEWCCALYNLTVAALLRGDALRPALARAAADLVELAPELPHDRLRTRVEGAGDLSVEAVADPDGLAVPTLAAALWACLGAGSPEEAVVRAAGLGGDADTVAAVAGGLAGARWGYAALPARWLSVLRGRRAIDRALRRVAGPAG